MESHSHGVFNYDEADFTLISHLLMVAECNARVIRVLSDDMDVFVLLILLGLPAQHPSHGADGKVR